jgi:formate hydrogenlyase subunit 6/NADH:ubiquinone oxidoreductase subunit I
VNPNRPTVHDDYTLKTVDPNWLQDRIKPRRHIALSPELCILCRACEDVCPWNCIFMLDPGIVQRTQDEAVEAEARESFAIFVVDDNACTRCSVCVERCPSDCLYYARLPEETGGARTMAAVPMAQKVDADVE